MANKILKTLVNNIGYKILAVVFAFILWLVVYNIDDPNKTVRFTTNVTVENESAVTDMNKCYEVLNGTNTVTFSVTAKRSVINKLEDTDFTATADMNRMIVDSDNKTARVPIDHVRSDHIEEPVMITDCRRIDSVGNIRTRNRKLRRTV